MALPREISERLFMLCDTTIEGEAENVRAIMAEMSRDELESVLRAGDEQDRQEQSPRPSSARDQRCRSSPHSDIGSDSLTYASPPFRMSRRVLPQ